MADRVKDKEPIAEVMAENQEEEVIEKVFTCKFCDKIFNCSQSLGGHQNAHRKERSAMKQHEQQQYNPLNPFVMPPAPSPSHIPSLFVPAPLHNHQVMYAPHHHHYAYAPQAAHLHRPIYAPHKFSTRYQPYDFSPYRSFGSNGTILPRVNPNPRLFANPSYGTIRPDSQSPYLSRGLNLEGVERFMSWKKNYGSYEQGSSSGGYQDRGGLGEGEDEKKLDLTLHL